MQSMLARELAVLVTSPISLPISSIIVFMRHLPWQVKVLGFTFFSLVKLQTYSKDAAITIFWELL